MNAVRKNIEWHDYGAEELFSDSKKKGISDVDFGGKNKYLSVKNLLKIPQNFVLKFRPADLLKCIDVDGYRSTK